MAGGLFSGPTSEVPYRARMETAFGEDFSDVRVVRGKDVLLPALWANAEPGGTVSERAVPRARTVADAERWARTTAPTIEAVLASSPAILQGSALHPDVSASLEATFGTSLAGTRVRADATARGRAEGLGARGVYSAGEIWLAHGAHPGSHPTLAHELAHAVQSRAGRDSAAPAYREEEKPDEYGFGDFVYEVLAGDFVDDPGFGAVIVRTLLTLIPYVDQAADVEDLVANLLHLLWDGRYDEFWVWFNVVTNVIGMVPEAGSAAKGVLKVLAKAAGGVLDAAALKTISHFLSKVDLAEGLEELGRLFERMDGPVHRVLDDILASVEGHLYKILDYATLLPANARGAVEQILRNLRHARARAPQMVQQALTSARKQLDDAVARIRAAAPSPSPSAGLPAPAHPAGASRVTPTHPPAPELPSHAPKHEPPTPAKVTPAPEPVKVAPEPEPAMVAPEPVPSALSPEPTPAKLEPSAASTPSATEPTASSPKPKPAVASKLTGRLVGKTREELEAAFRAISDAGAKLDEETRKEIELLAQKVRNAQDSGVVPSGLESEIAGVLAKFEGQIFANNPVLGEAWERAIKTLADDVDYADDLETLETFSERLAELDRRIRTATGGADADLLKRAELVKEAKSAAERTYKAARSKLKANIDAIAAVAKEEFEGIVTSALPEGVQAHHLLYKALFPDAALSDKNLILALRKIGGQPDELHDLLHLLSSGMEDRWKNLEPLVERILRERTGL